MMNDFKDNNHEKLLSPITKDNDSELSENHCYIFMRKKDSESLVLNNNTHNDDDSNDPKNLSSSLSIPYNYLSTVEP